MILSFTATVEQFDKAAYLKALQAEMRRVFMKAGQKFLLAAVPRIPVFTGFARGAFRNAEDLFGKVSGDGPSSARIRSSRGGGKGNTPGRAGYYYYPPGGGRIARTPEAGRQFATPTDDILDIVGGSLASGKTSFYFRFKVDIKYVDDFEAVWQAFKFGGEQLEAFVKANLKLPNPLQYVTRKIVKGG